MALLRKCPTKYFYSADDKASFLRRKKLSVMQLFDPFVQLEAVVEYANKKRISKYKLSTETPFLVEVEAVAIMDVIDSEAEARSKGDADNRLYDLKALLEKFNHFRERLPADHDDYMREMTI